MKKVLLLVAFSLFGGAIGAILVLRFLPARDSADFEARLVSAVEKVLPSTVSLHLRDDPNAGGFAIERLIGTMRKRSFHSAAGVAVRKGGFVLTNAHVVREFVDFLATTHSGKTVSAALVGSVPEMDIALIKLPVDLPVLEFCHFDKVRQGKPVFSVGSPYELPFSVSFGVVSALHRGRIGFSSVEDYIQTDAAINPGSSGGPLCTLDGELIGMCSGLYSLKSGSNGINFAVPIYLISQVIDKLINGEPVGTSYFGARVNQLSFTEAVKAGLESSTGALIYKVFSGSPADRAGLKAGDIVMFLDKSKVSSAQGFRALLFPLEPGRELTLDVVRGGERVKLNVTLGKVDAMDPHSIYLRGLEALVEKPDVEDLRRAGAAFGAALYSVDYNGVASRLKMSPRDILLSVNGREFKTLAELKALMNEAIGSGKIEVKFYSFEDKTILQKVLDLKRRKR